MAKSISILFVTSEVYPFTRICSLSDISYSFPLAMRELGYDIRVMMPKYGSVSERKNRIHEINRLKDMPIQVGEDIQPATVKSSSINNPRSKVQAYITTNQKFFDLKKGVYHDPKSWTEYPDNPERFIFFNKSVIETCLLLGWFPDIIHCNDWQTGLIPGYIKTLHPAKFKKTKVVYTVRNFLQQGSFQHFDIKKTGLPPNAFNAYNHKNAVNFLKGGLYYADFITTVSPSYSKEILSDKSLTNGLNSILKEASRRFKGILCGIDYYCWNPQTDPELKYKLKTNILDFKKQNKQILQKQFGLDQNPDIPIIGIISQITIDKGIPLFLETVNKFFKENVQFVILGEGDGELKKSIQALSKQNKNKFSYKFELSETLSHLIEAGADIYLSTANIEPCDLNIMYSLKYGTVPIARLSGGTRDIVDEFNPKTKKGNSVVFNNYKSSDLANAIKTALDYYKNKDLWEKIIENGMKADFSWKKSAKKYDELYKKLTKD